MSDRQPSKKPASEAAKSFTIPARPAFSPPDGHNIPAWPGAEAENISSASSPEPERSLVDQPEQQALSSDALATATQKPHASEQPSVPVNPPSAPAFPQTPPTPERPFVPSSPPPMSQAPRAPLAQIPQPPQPPPVFDRPVSAAPAFQPNTRTGPVAGPSAPAQLPPRRRMAGKQRILYIALAVIAIVIVLSGLLSQQLLHQQSAASAQNSALVFSGSGPYVRLPLTADQINAIRHLAGHMKYKALASLYVSHMSLDDEIGQLIMVEYNQPTYSSDLDYMLHTLHVGGVILYQFQMSTFKQTKADIAHMQQRANIPLLISTDEEGSPYVDRLTQIYGPRLSPTQIGDSGNVDVATQQGLKTSKDLAALGINEDLAPDVDVNQVNGYDMVTRTFGNTAAQVIKYAGAYLQAMQGNGTVACIKHFPGLGGALTDAHTGLPVVHSTKQQIYNVDLAPFKAFIQSPDALLNPGMIMPTDVLLPAIDPKYPAELSHTFMTDILRDEFGYDGVVLTDALYMKGITDTWNMYTASVMALQAGDDMLLGANGTQQTIGVINAIKQALADGQLTKARIDESATRIIALKMQYHLMPTYIPGA